jgi:GNAT superfamily N-acetyltransferase
MSGPSPRRPGTSVDRDATEAVRTATGEDARRLCQLAEELGTAVVSQRGGRLLVDPEQSRRDGGVARGWVEERLADQATLALVGTLDEVVIGFAVCHLAGVHPYRGVLDACFVEPGARGVGVGRLLLDTVVAWLEEQGAEGMDGIALPGDRAAKNFYESAGFKARMLTMHREIE